MRTSSGLGAAKTGQIVCFSLTICFVLFIAFHALLTDAQCRQSENCNRENSTAQETQEINGKESLWGRTLHDPTAFFTAVLCVFTAVLAVASLWQGRLIIRADVTARTAADAALATANAINTQNVHIENSIAEAKRSADEMSNLAKATDSANKISRENLIAANRAWLQPMVFIREIGHDKANNLMTVSFHFEFKNFGTTPATHVHIESELDLYMDDIAGHQKTVSEKAKSGGAIIERIVFPGDVLESNHILTVHQDDVERSIHRHSGALIINIVGCVDYQFPFSDGSRQTWFAYAVLENTGLVLRPDKIPILAAKLALGSAFGARYYAD